MVSVVVVCSFLGIEWLVSGLGLARMFAAEGMNVMLNGFGDGLGRIFWLNSSHKA